MATDGGPTVALVREVSPEFAGAQLTFVERRPIDIEVARRQHATYVALLADLGLDVVMLPAAPGHADGVFVEDTLVVIDDLVVVTRPGAVSRRGEIASVRAAIESRGMPVAAIEPPGTLDGGDVLLVGDTVHVGHTTRTNAAAIDQLRALAEPLGRQVVPVDVTGALHLKSVVTALPDGTIVADVARVGVGAFGTREILPAPEPAGANVLPVAGTVLVSAAAPATAALVRTRGFPVETVDIGELEKAEAGLTCLCVLLPSVTAR